MCFTVIALPHIIPLALTIYFFSVFYALTRYRFPRQDIRDSFDEILHNINDMIIKANNAACINFNKTEQELLGNAFTELAPEKNGKKFADILKRTVDTHLTGIYSRLNISNRIELINLVNKET